VTVTRADRDARSLRLAGLGAMLVSAALRSIADAADGT
jgi:hypothetical protein